MSRIRSLHWCIYTLVHTYLRLVLPSLRPLRGLCSSCSRPAISTLLAVLRHLHSSHRLKHLHTSPRVSPTGLSRSFHQLDLLRCSPLLLRVSGNLGSTLPSSILASRTTMVFSLNCSLSRFYRGIIQSSSDLLYPHVYYRLRRSRWLSYTSSQSPALRRLLVGE